MSASTTPASAGAEVRYPESDGKPMGETGFHVDAILSLHAAFLIAFRDRPDVYIASDMFLYFEQGNPRAVKASDVMVIQGVGNHPRRTFKLWVENAAPSVIFEVTSDETRREDATTKPEVYARIGVPEYFLFDPLGDYLDPQMQAYRLDGDRYARIVPDAAGGLPSAELGLSFRPEGRLIRVIDDRTGQPILTGLETFEQLQETIAEAQGLARSAEVMRQKIAAERKKAEREKTQAEREKTRAEREKMRADALEVENDRLRALLGGGEAGSTS